ncbi:hypothetical protein S40285_10793 [Stachybotrys chlorohalonatus IBT 40285]|uniref:Uncharacterized protein n=1 Tax=Stachybotrys chlorohalonatus (strain IBT 40285) TaxID=1283841 RepID=A0A084QZL4_STAC4|nr:hypothetical protein S40285_10793 [Stachybotrys chlorohalonata IBT 40285]
MSDMTSRSCRKLAERDILLAEVAKFGHYTDMPCTRCYNAEKRCLIAPGSSRYYKCIRLKKACDGSSVAHSLSRLTKEDAKLEAAEESAVQALAEATARLTRVRKTREALRKRRDEAIRRGLRGLDEEDEVSEEPLIIETQQAVGDLQSMGAFGVVDWDAVGFDFAGPSSETAGSSSGGVVHG